ncbi:unnamed protein product [Chrysoparadoxa australica]
MSGCVYDCQHPLYGDTGGECNVSTAGDYYCTCSPGYRTVDDYNFPSCVPELIWTSVRIVLIILNLLCVVNAARRMWKLWRDRPKKQAGPVVASLTSAGSISQSESFGEAWASLSSINRIRMRFYTASILMVAPILIFAVFRYPLGGLFSPHFSVVCGFGYPAACMICELWMKSLPLQLLPPGTAAYALKKITENRAVVNRIYVLFAFLGFIAPGVAIFWGPAWGRTAIDFISLVVTSSCYLTSTIVGYTLYKKLTSLEDEAARERNQPVVRKIILSMVVMNAILISKAVQLSKAGCPFLTSSYIADGGVFWSTIDAIPMLRKTPFLGRASYGIVPAAWCIMNQEVMKYAPPNKVPSGSRTVLPT